MQVVAPSPSTGFLTGVAKVVGGGKHTLALMCNGTVMAWGDNTYGQLGRGNTANSLAPTALARQTSPRCPTSP